jgi:exodeoxyribonuclease VII large subunit
MPVLICPAKVQGEGAGAEIAEAITRLGHSGLVEVIIVGRGGGSIEDLWAFNEEVVARAIAAAPVPIVSGVGHEVDFTIADFVADLRAATPSVAAELTVPVRAQLEEAVFVLRARLDRAVRRRVTELRHTLGNARGRLPDPRRRLASLRFELDDGVHRAATGMRRRCSGARRELARLAAALRQRHPSARVGRARERTGKLRRRLEAAMAAGLAERRRFLAVIEGKLEALSPVAILERGYAIARRPDGRVLRRAAEARVGEPLEVLLGEGALGVRVETTLPQTGQLALQLGENS